MLEAHCCRHEERCLDAKTISLLTELALRPGDGFADTQALTSFH